MKKVKSDAASGELGGQAYTICDDLGLILNYVVVPDTGETWVHDALDEVVTRHGINCPKTLFVDCNCCNGKLKSEAAPRSAEASCSVGLRLWQKVLVKKLDGLHCIMRVTREVNAEHPRAAGFARKLSRAIYTKCPDDLQALTEARENAGLYLSEKEKKSDRVYIRTQIAPGPRCAANFLIILKEESALDAEHRRQFIQKAR